MVTSLCVGKYKGKGVGSSSTIGLGVGLIVTTGPSSFVGKGVLKVVLDNVGNEVVGDGVLVGSSVGNVMSITALVGTDVGLGV